jgi:hypothetical protein
MISPALLDHAIRFEKLEDYVEARLAPHVFQGLPSRTQWHLLRARALATEPDALAKEIKDFLEARTAKKKTAPQWSHRVQGSPLYEWIQKEIVWPIESLNFSSSPLGIRIDESMGFRHKDLGPHALRIAICRLIDYILLLIEEKDEP